MNWKRESWKLGLILAVFLGSFYFPVERIFGGGEETAPLVESLYLIRWYAREHVIPCLLPAFFIAGALSVFLSQGSVMRYLGAGANKILAYGVDSISGTIQAVCYCLERYLSPGLEQPRIRYGSTAGLWHRALQYPRPRGDVDGVR